jgi:GNAT superfamily N-acetyltransferase
MITNDLQIEIKPLDEVSLELLEKEFPTDALSGHHRKRLEIQKNGEGLYLIAWHNNIPVGHFLLAWNAPHNENVTKYIDITKNAYLGAGRTHESHRRKGVATKLIQEAEKLAREHGCTTIGLQVGATDNPDARRLYEKLGYKDWNHGTFTISWEYTDKNGNKGTESEVVTYMQKELR